MKLTSPSSILVTWDDQVADYFSLVLFLDSTDFSEHVITGTNYTFTGLPYSHTYDFYMFAFFEGCHGYTSYDIVIVTTDCKLPLH